MEQSSVIDIFCGVGGLTHGFHQDGFSVVAGIDSDVSCKYAYEHNNHATFIHKRIDDIDPGELRALYPDGHVKILVGCAPCQPFSTYTRKRPKGERWKLVSSFADLIESVEPDIVSMENVPQLVKFDGGTVFDEFVRRLERSYRVSWSLVHCPDYGVPQKRTRLVLFASKFGEVQLIEKTHEPDRHVTVDDAIGHLPPIEAGGVCEADALHRASGMSDLNKKRIAHSTPGGSWQDWNADLVAECHKRETGKTYRSVYGRMRSGEPSPTITTQFYGFGSGRFGHPKQNRAISLREAALLQTFPPDYEFVRADDPHYFKILGRHIGNAVPVTLGRVIAKSLSEKGVDW